MFDVLLQTPTQVAEYSHRNVLCNRKDGHKATQEEEEDDVVNVDVAVEEGEKEENIKLKNVNIFSCVDYHHEVFVAC